MGSLWTDGLRPPEFPALDGDAETDVLVLGGGMAGVLCARRLREAGVRCLLLEGRRIGGGVTGRSAAVLTIQQDTLYRDVIRERGLDAAERCLAANRRAVEDVRALAAQIDCDFEERPTVLFSRDDLTLLECEAAALKTLGFEAELTDGAALPFPAAGALRYPGMAQLHPQKLLYGAARGLTIYENTPVRHLEGTTAVTGRGRVHARKVIVTTHVPFESRRGLYGLKLREKRACVLALANAPALDCCVAEAAPDGVFLRTHGPLLLLGGSGGPEALRALAAQRFPEALERRVWTARDCVSLDGLPYIGPYAPKQRDVFAAAGFGFRGMSASMAAAALLTDLALGRENPSAPVFEPSRNPFTGRLLPNALSVYFHGPPRPRP